MAKIASILLQRLFTDDDPELKDAFTGWDSGGWVLTCGVVENQEETPLSLALKACQEAQRVVDDRERLIESQVNKLADIFKAATQERIAQEAKQWGMSREVQLGNGTTHTEWTFSETRLRRLIEELLIAPVACPHCNGTGSVDSGGTTPWGEGINIPCAHCHPEQVNALYDHLKPKDADDQAG